eukprot:1137654-Pelagomonas_calceolata.AAC.5
MSELACNALHCSAFRRVVTLNRCGADRYVGPVCSVVVRWNDKTGVPMRCPTLPKAESAVCQAACLLGCRSLQDGCRVL